VNDIAEWALRADRQRTYLGCVLYLPGYFPPAPSLKFRVETGTTADTVVVHAAPDIAERVVAVVEDLDKKGND
jgi:hypothetical protein